MFVREFFPNRHPNGFTGVLTLYSVVCNGHCQSSWRYRIQPTLLQRWRGRIALGNCLVCVFLQSISIGYAGGPGGQAATGCKRHTHLSLVDLADCSILARYWLSGVLHAVCVRVLCSVANLRSFISGQDGWFGWSHHFTCSKSWTKPFLDDTDLFLGCFH